MSVLETEAQRKGLNAEFVQTQLQASRIFKQKETVYNHHTMSKQKQTLK